MWVFCMKYHGAVDIPKHRHVAIQTKMNALWSSLELMDKDRNSPIMFSLVNLTFGKSSMLKDPIDWNMFEWDIILTYPKFNFKEPLFLSDQDKELFHQNPDNKQTLASSYDPELLHGTIRVIFGSIAHNGLACGWSSDLMDFVDRSEVHDAKDDGERYYTADNIVPILTQDSHIFQHFLDGALPKIIQVLPFLRLPNVKLALQEPRDQIIKDIIVMLNLLERVIWVKGNAAVTSRFQINSCISPPIHPLLWTSMRELLDVNDHLPYSLSSCKVILLNHAQTHNGGRNIKNQQEVIKYLMSRYGKQFTLFIPQNTLSKTKEFFSKARIILGVHGGALYNINFAPKASHVIELMPTSETGGVTKRLAHTIIWKMSSVRGQHYWRLALPPLDDIDNVYLPLSKLKEVLDKVDHSQLHAH